MPNYGTVTPEELNHRIEQGDRLCLIDVREPMEYELARVDGFQLLPLSRFNEWASTLNPEDEIVFMCHHGIRSAQVCEFLSRQGYAHLQNLAGGIDRWSHEVDRRIPVY